MTAIRSAAASKGRRIVSAGIRSAIRYIPPRGRGIRLAHAWSRRVPPDASLYVSRERGHAQLRCDLRDELSRLIYYRGWVDLGLESFVRRWLRTNDTYVDVGAHIGYMAALAATAVGPSGRVVAFEPSPDTFDKLAAAFESPDLGQVEVVHAAVAGADGQATFFTTAGGGWAHQAYRDSLHPADGMTTRTQVRTVSLDGYFPNERLRLLKIDVEGGEEAVLVGGKELISTGRCEALIVELNPEALARAGSSVPTLIGQMRAAGYRSHRCRSDGTLQPWWPVDVTTEFADAVFLPH